MKYTDSFAKLVQEVLFDIYIYDYSYVHFQMSEYMKNTNHCRSIPAHVYGINAINPSCFDQLREDPDACGCGG